jgi:hypothetical protein
LSIQASGFDLPDKQVTTAATDTLAPVHPDSAHHEDAAHFVRWLLAHLKLTPQESPPDALLELPEADRPPFAGQQRLRLPLTGQPQAGQEPLDWDSRFGRWLLDRLARLGPALHARPRQQPMSVTEVTSALFSAYKVENGQVHLAGCQLTDHPFLRLSFSGTNDDPAIRHIFVAPDGSSVSDELIPRLGLDELEPITQLPPRLEESAIRSLIAAGRRIAAKQSTARDPAAAVVEPVVVTIAWVRHAEGRLQFTIGKKTEFLPFSSWAKLLTPRPFVGRTSGASAFHLAATDDGCIEAADQIAVCQESNRRVLRQELVECSVTGKHVLPEFVERCPVSGKPTLRGEFAQCTQCRQRVSKAVMQEGLCAACRSLASVNKEDPRLQWIFAEHPGLDRWSHWQLAETADVYIATAARLLKRLLIVVEKETLIPRRVATCGRLSSNWIDMMDSDYTEILE